MNTSNTTARRRLTRLPDEGRMAGVCAGIADYLAVDPTLVRLAWIILSLVPGAIVGGLLAYFAAWIIMPAGVSSGVVRPRLTRSSQDRKVAGVCGGLAAYFNLDPTVVRLAVVVLTIYPGAVVFGLIGYGIAWVVMPLEPPAALEPSALVA